MTITGKTMEPKVLGLRTTDSEGKSWGGFQWPLEPGAEVTAPDWNDKPLCGGGLHFLPWGEGAGSLLDWFEGAKALVIEPLGEVVDIDGDKSKCPKARVVAVFDNIPEAAIYIAEHGGQGKAVAGLAGASGKHGAFTAGFKGQATAGDYGQATAGDDGQATAGFKGQATAGVGGQATAGDDGQATAGDDGQATAGDEGIIIIARWDGERRRAHVGYIGETLDSEGKPLEPGQAYQLNKDGNFVRAEGQSC